MLQTALSNAQHRALMALVHAYAGFQLHNGQFYVVESRVSPYISITFRTFSNYLTDLKDLGLLEMLWRCPNQYGEKSIWRMKPDVVLSSGQLALELSVEELPGAQAGGDGSHAACDHEFHPVFSHSAGSEPAAWIWREAT